MNRTISNKLWISRRRRAVAFVADAEADPDAAATAMLDASGLFSDRVAADLHRYSFDARMSQLKYEREAGKVVEVEHVAKVVGDALARVRSRLLAIPAEQSPQLHRCKPMNALQDLLLEVISEALEELAGDAGFAARH